MTHNLLTLHYLEGSKWINANQSIQYSRFKVPVVHLQLTVELIQVHVQRFIVASSDTWKVIKLNKYTGVFDRVTNKIYQELLRVIALATV